MIIGYLYFQLIDPPCLDALLLINWLFITMRLQYYIKWVWHIKFIAVPYSPILSINELFIKIVLTSTR